MIVVMMDAIQKKNDFIGGLLLAFTTIKPNIVILLVILVLIWAFSRRRWGLVRWFFIWLMLLITLGLFFIPDWPLQNIRAIVHYPDYTTVSTMGSVLIDWLPGVGLQLNWGLTIFLFVLTIIEWASTWGKDFTRFLWTVCFTLTVSQWIGITTDPGNFTLLFLPLVLLFSVIKERWPRWGDWFNLVIMVLMFGGLWALFLRTIEYGNQPQQHPIMFVPMPLITLVGLYWARWWFLRPNRNIVKTPLES
jgi:hypothetical protein